jgi:hypothetical protein
MGPIGPMGGGWGGQAKGRVGGAAPAGAADYCCVRPVAFATGWYG